MVTASRDTLAHLKSEAMEADLGLALADARKCVAARDAVNSEYGPGLRYRETDPFHGTYVAPIETLIPALEKAVAFKPPELPQIQPAPGPLRLLTDNADEPAEKRLAAAGVTVAYDPPVNWIADYPAPPSKLFNGGSDRNGNTVVAVMGAPVWNVTLDLQKAYEVDKVEVWLRSFVPVYVDILTSIDGKEFQKVDQMFPKGQIGWLRSRDLGLKARYVRLSMGTLNSGTHLIHQVKVWGRELIP
jgi:hypothetical protein